LPVAPAPENAIDVSLDPQVAPAGLMFDVAVVNAGLAGVKPAVAVHTAPAFKVMVVCPVTVCCSLSGPSKESEKGDSGALIVNVPLAFPVFERVSAEEEAGLPIAPGGNAKVRSGWMASVAPAGVADSPTTTWVWVGSFVSSVRTPMTGIPAIAEPGIVAVTARDPDLPGASSSTAGFTENALPVTEAETIRALDP
jgi:hypothetical protein